MELAPDEFTRFLPERDPPNELVPSDFRAMAQQLEDSIMRRTALWSHALWAWMADRGLYSTENRSAAVGFLGRIRTDRTHYHAFGIQLTAFNQHYSEFDEVVELGALLSG